MLSCWTIGTLNSRSLQCQNDCLKKRMGWSRGGCFSWCNPKWMGFCVHGLRCSKYMRMSQDLYRIGWKHSRQHLQSPCQFLVSRRSLQCVLLHIHIHIHIHRLVDKQIHVAMPCSASWPYFAWWHCSSLLLSKVKENKGCSPNALWMTLMHFRLSLCSACCLILTPLAFTRYDELNESKAMLDDWWCIASLGSTHHWCIVFMFNLISTYARMIFVTILKNKVGCMLAWYMQSQYRVPPPYDILLVVLIVFWNNEINGCHYCCCCCCATRIGWRL